MSKNQNISHDLFKEKKWFGEFFIPGRYEDRFCGEITYSPENGVTLSYLIPENDLLVETNILHGILSSGERCTLVGNFNTKFSELSFKNGVIERGDHRFLYLVIGDLLSKKDQFQTFNFSLTGLQGFFFPRYKDLIKYSEKPLLSIDTEDSRIEIGNNASFGFLSDILTHIYSRNKNALKELKECFETIQRKYADARFMFKKDIAYRIYVKLKNPYSIETICNYIFNIANLFSILIYSPVYPENICITKKINNGQISQLYIYPPMLLDRRTIDLILKERFHFDMPITNANIDLSLVIEKWLNSSTDYFIIVESIQRETGVYNLHTLHGELILYIAQLESISYSENVKETKYEYPVNKYGNEKIKKGIRTIFKKIGENDIGKGISNIRNEIAHVKKPKKILRKLTLENLFYLSRYLQMTIIGFILTNLGIKREIINEYQNKFAPDI